jgi:hypothetical protein
MPLLFATWQEKRHKIGASFTQGLTAAGATSPSSASEEAEGPSALMNGRRRRTLLNIGLPTSWQGSYVCVMSNDPTWNDRWDRNRTVYALSTLRTHWHIQRMQRQRVAWVGTMEVACLVGWYNRRARTVKCMPCQHGSISMPAGPQVSRSDLTSSPSPKLACCLVALQVVPPGFFSGPPISAGEG